MFGDYSNGGGLGGLGGLATNPLFMAGLSILANSSPQINRIPNPMQDVPSTFMNASQLGMRQQELARQRQEEAAQRNALAGELIDSGVPEDRARRMAWSRDAIGLYTAERTRSRQLAAMAARQQSPYDKDEDEDEPTPSPAPPVAAPPQQPPQPQAQAPQVRQQATQPQYAAQPAPQEQPDPEQEAARNEVSQKFDSFARSSLGKTVAEVANSYGNQTQAARFLSAAKSVGLSPESQIDAPTMSAPSKAIPLARAAGLGETLSDSDWQQAYRGAYQTSLARQDAAKQQAQQQPQMQNAGPYYTGGPKPQMQQAPYVQRPGEPRPQAQPIPYQGQPEPQMQFLPYAGRRGGAQVPATQTAPEQAPQQASEPSPLANPNIWAQAVGQQPAQTAPAQPAQAPQPSPAPAAPAQEEQQPQPAPNKTRQALVTRAQNRVKDLKKQLRFEETQLDNPDATSGMKEGSKLRIRDLHKQMEDARKTVEEAKQNLDVPDKYDAKTYRELKTKLGMQKEETQPDREQTANIVTQDIDKSVKLIKGNTHATGVTGKAWSYFKSTSDAAELDRKFGMIRANLSLDKLQQMRNASPTGSSGLGSVTEGEHKLLQEQAGALNIGAKPEELRENLARIRWMQQDIIHNGKISAALKAGKDANTAIPDFRVDEKGDLYAYANGKKYRVKE